MLNLVDTHCHLDYIERENGDLDAVMTACKETGVNWLINPSVSPDRFEDVLRITERYENVFAAAAVHPTDVQDCCPMPGMKYENPNSKNFEWLSEIKKMIEHSKVIAIGETGLDYYHSIEHVALQHEFFRTFLALGRDNDLPVIIHDRESHDDVHKLVSEYPGVRGVMHCFSGDVAFARTMIDKGFYISFAGNLTYKNAHQLHEAARETPLEWILVETDSPFLSPMPFRGKPNEPARVKYVAEKIAELKGISVEEVCDATTENARKVFKLPC